MKRGISFTIITLLSLFLLGYGSPAAETYSLDDCIETALRNNYGVVAARNSYDAARGEVYTSWGRILPSISISTRAAQSWSGFSFTEPGTGRMLTGGIKSNIYSGSLNFGQSYGGMGLYTYANIRKKYHDRGSSLNGYIGAKLSLILSVKENYLNLLKAKMLLDVSKEAVKRGEERLRVVQSRFDLGSASMSDVLKAKVQFGSDRLDLVARTNAYKLSKANLAYIMGIDVNREFDVEEDLAEKNVNISFADALDEAMSENPDYHKARFNFYGAQDQKLMAYSNFLPTLSLGLSHSTNVDTLTNLTRFDRSDASSYIYATLNFNIFNGASDYAALRAAGKNVDTFRQALKDTENKVALELKQAFLDIEQSNEARKLADESVAAAQEDLNLVKEKYKLGAATILEVLDAEVSLKQAQTSKVQAIFDFSLAVSKLEKVLGR